LSWALSITAIAGCNFLLMPPFFTSDFYYPDSPPYDDDPYSGGGSYRSLQLLLPLRRSLRLVPEWDTYQGFGAFSFEPSSSPRYCQAYSTTDSDAFNPAMKSAKAFGILAAISLGCVVALLSSLEIFVKIPGSRRCLYTLCRILLALAVPFQMCTFLAFLWDPCRDFIAAKMEASTNNSTIGLVDELGSCVLGPTGFVSVAAVMLHIACLIVICNVRLASEPGLILPVVMNGTRTSRAR